MNQPKSSKLNHTEQEQTAVHGEQLGQHALQTSHPPLEFATPEEMIRHDCRLARVPPSLVERLRASIAQEPTAERPWWSRFLGQAG